MGSNFFRCWYYTTNVFQSVLLLIIRLYWGFLFFIGGYDKITNMPPFIDFMSQFGMSTSWAYIVTVVELVCGILIFFGFLARIGAALTSLVMIGAYITAHPAQLLSFFRDPSYFFSAPAFPFLFASLIVLFFGAGMFSVDAIIKRCFMENCSGSSKKKRK